MGVKEAQNGPEGVQQRSIAVPNLLPCGHRPPREDEDDSRDVQRPPDEERQCSSAASHRGQPGQADEQDRAQAENHAHHRQGAHVISDVRLSHLENTKKSANKETKQTTPPNKQATFFVLWEVSSWGEHEIMEVLQSGFNLTTGRSVFQRV